MKKYIPPSAEDGCKPDINYPCSWHYKIIGQDREAIIEVVTQSVKAAYLLTDSKTSSGGRYVSMNLELVVSSEEERLEIYSRLAGNPAIKMVL